MKHQKLLLSLFFLYLFGAVSAQSQLNPKPQSRSKRELKGEIITQYSNERPEYHAGVPVWLKGYGVQTETNSKGEFRLGLPDSLVAGLEIRVEVGKPGYAIFRPPQGRLVLRKDLTQLEKIEILPLGHPLFKSPEEIDKWADEVRKRAKQEKLPLSQYIQEWAIQYGFKPEEADAEIKAWMKQVEIGKDPAKLAKAEFLRENFTLADTLLAEASLAHKISILQQLIGQYFRVTASQKDQWVMTFIDNSQLNDNSYMMYESGMPDVNRRKFRLVAVDNGVARFSGKVRQAPLYTTGTINIYPLDYSSMLPISQIVVLEGPNGTGWKDGKITDDQVSKQLRIIEIRKRLVEINQEIHSYSFTTAYIFDAAIISYTLYDLSQNKPPTWRKVLDYTGLAIASAAIIYTLPFKRGEVRLLKTEKKSLEEELKSLIE